MVLIDLSKAFDSICHSTLLLKLRSLGTSSQALKWFESYKSQAVYSIRYLSIWWAYDNTWRASRLHLRSHVVELIYLNDLPSAVKCSCTDSYVDDKKIYCSFSAKNMNSCLVKMTEDLRLIAGWCYSHQLLINPSKTNLFFIRDKAAPKQGIRHQSTFPRPRTHSGILS